VSNSISGSATYYGGGGSGISDLASPSGVAGGLGGGGTGGYQDLGATYHDPTNGSPNTGGGGGGYSVDQSAGGGDGGSGVVIISYPNTKVLAAATGTYSFANTGGNYVFTFTGNGTITF
jgi:hypothetical protein